MIEARGCPRTQAYNWLANKMNITPDKCHIGMFNEEQCEKVMDICHVEKINVIRARNGAEKIFRKEGMNIEHFRTLDPDNLSRYISKEFLPNSVHRGELKQIFGEVDGNPLRFIALVWARRNPTDPFAQTIEQRLNTGKVFMEIEF